MSAQICVVTGATSGIGREAARLLAAGGARVIGIGRDPERCARTARELCEASGGQVEMEVADLACQADIRDLAGRLTDRLPRIDVLVNNAGTFTFTRRESPDGVEMQMAVNWLAGYMLTGLLMPLLQAAPAARVVSLSSGSHFSGRFRWSDPLIKRGYHGLKAYDATKLAAVLFTYELTRRLGVGSRIASYAVDPGLVKTDIAMKGNGALVRGIWRLRTRGGISPEEAARSVLACAVGAEAAGKTGMYWKEGRPLASSERSYDREDWSRLWSLGEELSGVRYP
jgi:retinol dehydrogenase 12